MRASLDTNAIIHFYKAGLQDILFDFFDEGVFIYEQIRKIELENHGQDVLFQVDIDIAAGKIELYTDQKLKKLQVYKIFEYNVNENRNLYGTGDLGIWRGNPRPFNDRDESAACFYHTINPPKV